MTAVSDDITTRLRRDCMSLIADEAAETIDRLRVERDEARVDACRLEADARGRDARMSGMSCHYFNPKQIAKERGWDCFREITND